MINELQNKIGCVAKLGIVQNPLVAGTNQAVISDAVVTFSAHVPLHARALVEFPPFSFHLVMETARKDKILCGEP